MKWPEHCDKKSNYKTKDRQDIWLFTACKQQWSFMEDRLIGLFVFTVYQSFKGYSKLKSILGLYEIL